MELLKYQYDQFDKWKSALENLQKAVEKDLNEIRRQKVEVQSIKTEIVNILEKGKYIRDENRIIISAPEIIIGNVDNNGVLLNSIDSKVTLRANNVAVEAVDKDKTDGTIINRASNIITVAEDPGCDGHEHVVNESSRTITLARNIVLQSNNDKECFSHKVYHCEGTGVRIHADEHIVIESTLPNETFQKQLSDRDKALKEQVNSWKTKSNTEKKDIDELIQKMKKLIDGKDFNSEDNETRTNMVDINELHQNFNQISLSLNQAMDNYFHTLSLIAENNRQVKCVENQKKESDNLKNEFKDKTTGADISLYAEKVISLSIDGDGNIRTNKEAGFSVFAPKVDMKSYQQNGALITDGSVNINAQNINISTANPKLEVDDKGKIKKGNYPAVGKVKITSKDITVESVDYELKDNKMQETALTKEGKLNLRAESVFIDSSNTEGKATGVINLNAKVLEIKSMDLDKDKRTDKELAKGSSMIIVAEKMFAGSKDKKNKSKNIQIVSENVGVFADKTAEMQQGDAKSIVQLEGGNVSLSGSKTNIFGETTLNGKTNLKDEMKAGKATIENVEIKTSFKTPCTTEGFAVPSPPSTNKLSAKLKEEDAPKSK